MGKKLVNGELVDMDTTEEAAFEAARTLTLPLARRLMRQRIAERRSAAEGAGFLYLGVRYPSDAWSLARLGVLARRAAAQPAGFSVRVVALDDSETALNAAEMAAFDLAAGDHFLACSANARTLRQAVAAAADADAAQAVNIDVGWP